MIVPRTRLLLWVALIVLPFSAIGSTVPGALEISAWLIGGLVTLVLADALLARGRLDGLRVELPGLVRLQKDRPGFLGVRIHNEPQTARPIRLGFAFPQEIAAEDDRTALLPAGAVSSRIEWPLAPSKRGLYLLDRAYLEGVSPLGFWSVRRSQPVRAELRVYPNLFDERKNVAAVFLRRANLGAIAQRRAGQGREFEKLREYLPGDSLTDVHWKASAKRGHPVTKVFQIERTQEVYVIVDVSRLSARAVRVEGGGGKWSAASSADGAIPPSTFTLHSTLERYVTSALILGLAAEQQGDQFGLVTFSDRVLSFVRAKSGQAHYDACRDRLYTLQPQGVSPDFEELCSFLRLRLRKRALLIFLTTLDDPMLAESFARATELINRQHLLLVNMLQPEGATPLFSDGAPAGDLDDVYGRLGGHLRWRDLRDLSKTLERRGVRFSLLDPTRLAAQLVAQHAEVKGRQLV
jgi:uncharacterized protein (DUF58 family)